MGEGEKMATKGVEEKKNYSELDSGTNVGKRREENDAGIGLGSQKRAYLSGTAWRSKVTSGRGRSNVSLLL